MIRIYLTTLTCALLFFFSAPGLTAELTYEYDELNRLISIEQPGRYFIEYTYDEVGNRISKTVTPVSLDDDTDFDGIDLYLFIMQWDETAGSLPDFAGLFGRSN